MTRQADDPNEMLTQRQATRSEPLLDRLDRAISSFGRAVWHVLIEGFAAYGQAQYGVPICLASDQDIDRCGEQTVIPAVPHPLAVEPYDELRGDFPNLHSLIESIPAKD
jgi:hypothetical protein